jgi:hypothetical protein
MGFSLKSVAGAIGGAALGPIGGVIGGSGLTGSLMGNGGLLTGATDAIGITDSGAPDRALQMQALAMMEANKLQRQQYEDTVARSYPYLTKGLGSYRDLADFGSAQDRFSVHDPLRDANPLYSMDRFRRGDDRFGMADFQKDPGYQFRMDEGLKAIDRSAAARGSLNSGATLKALTNYGQNLASSEYNNAYNRFNNDFSNAADRYDTNYNNAYNRFNNDRTTRFNELSNLANYGVGANSIITGQGATTANNMSNNQIEMGNARANAEMNKKTPFQTLWDMGLQGASAYGAVKNPGR